MKQFQWFLAAVAFALCVGLAVWTVAIRTGNVELRRNQHWAQLRATALRLEADRVGLKVHLQRDPKALAARLRWMQQQPGGGLVAPPQEQPARQGHRQAGRPTARLPRPIPPAPEAGGWRP